MLKFQLVKMTIIKINRKSLYHQPLSIEINGFKKGIEVNEILDTSSSVKSVPLSENNKKIVNIMV